MSSVSLGNINVPYEDNKIPRVRQEQQVKTKFVLFPDSPRANFASVTASGKLGVFTPRTEATFSSQFCSQGALLYLTAFLTQCIRTMTASSIPMTGMGTWPRILYTPAVGQPFFPPVYSIRAACTQEVHRVTLRGYHLVAESRHLGLLYRHRLLALLSRRPSSSSFPRCLPSSSRIAPEDLHSRCISHY